MGAVRSVQFVDSVSVVGAYESRGLAAWSIWQNTQFMFVYEGDSLADGKAQLETTLGWLENSAAIYTLKVYKEDGDITDKTPCHGSFNFRFEDVPLYGQRNQVNGSGNNNKDVMGAIAELRKEVAEIRDGSPGESNLGIIGEILDHEAIQPIIPIIAEGFVNLLMGKKNDPPAPGTRTHMISGIDQPRQVRIENAIKVLDKRVEDLPALLEKLARMAETKNTQFKMYVNMFMNL